MGIPNRIVLLAQGRKEEFKTSGDVYPGHIVQLQSDDTVVAHATSGGAQILGVVTEDALQGKDITQKIASGQIAPVYIPSKGDIYLFRLTSGQNVAEGASLMSNGDGTLTAYPNTIAGNKLYEITAASAGITNTNTETVFSNGSYTIPANFLVAGDVLHIRGRATVTAQNSTNTHEVKVYVGSTAIADSVAASLAANDVVEFDLELTVRTIGASGTYVVDGTIAAGTPGTITEKAVDLASTTIDTTATEAVAVKSTCSVANTGNNIRLDDYEITLDRAGLATQLLFATAKEAIDNSGGTKPFIRCIVN